MNGDENITIDDIDARVVNPITGEVDDALTELLDKQFEDDEKHHITVTGFDYSRYNINAKPETSENGVAYNDYAGLYGPVGGTLPYTPRKLVVTVTVKPKENFLGGNNVPTNLGSSGVTDSGDRMEELFEVPHVDVPLKDAIILKDQAVYSGQRYNLADFIDTDIIDGTNNEFVDINLAIKDENGNTINTFLIPAGSSEAEPQGFIDDTEAHAEANHPIGYKTTDYKVDYTIEPDYTKGTLTQADKIAKNDQNATAFVYIPAFKEKDDFVDAGSTVDLTVYDMEDVDNNTAHIAMEWACLRDGAPEPKGDPPAVKVTLTDITPGSTDTGHEITSADGTYQIDRDTDFRISATVDTDAATYPWAKMNGNDMEEGTVEIAAKTKTLNAKDEVTFLNTKNIDTQNIKTLNEATGKFTIHTNRPTYTLNINKQFLGDYAVPEGVRFVFTDSVYDTEVIATINANEFTGLTGNTSALLTVGRSYTLTEAFIDADGDEEARVAKDEQYETTFTPGNGLTGTATSSGDEEHIVNETFTFTVSEEPDGALTLNVVNEDHAEPPPVTGVSDNENHFNPYYIAAAVIALLGGSGTAYAVKRKKETAE